jgi:hypothetical protein
MGMTAVVSREQVRTTGLTAAAGALLLAVAFVMMIVAAPGHGPARAQLAGPARAHLARPSTVGLTTDACHQLTSRGDSPAVRACLAVQPPPAGLY